MGDRISVGVDNLRDWVAAGNDLTKLLLVLDDRPMKGLHPAPKGSGSNELLFDLRRIPDNDDSKKAWTALLRKRRGTSEQPDIIPVSVGIENQAPFSSGATLQLVVFPRYWLLVALALLLLGGVFVWLARSSDILRDSGAPPPAPHRRSYSLARTQMAWWFFVVLGSYMYIWLVTTDPDSLTNQVLILMGISSATGLGAMAVNSSKLSQIANQINTAAALAARIAQIQQELSAAPPPTNAPDLQKELQEKQGRLAEAKEWLRQNPAPPPPKSEGFLFDILRDEDGVSFHRFQISIWTLALSVIFVASVHQDLAMPQFSETLLGLMGISSGTYLGFKFPERPV